MDNTQRDRLIMEIHTACGKAVDLAERHDKTLYGNGQPGLVKRFDSLETTYNLTSKWIVGIITFSSSIIGAGITLLIKTYFSK